MIASLIHYKLAQEPEFLKYRRTLPVFCLENHFLRCFSCTDTKPSMVNLSRIAYKITSNKSAASTNDLRKECN
uniref:Actin n=1 Tax=Parascaris univalens TaxID=6257 RepID=A0A914ZFZ4_PARUN